MAKAQFQAPLAGYETVFLTRSEMGDDQLKILQDRLNNVVTAYKGELVMHEDWGSKKLAYKIENEQRARYSYFVYTGEGNVVAEVERNLRLHDHVLRFISVNLAKEFNRETFVKHRDEVKAQAKKREEEREARREEREASRRRFAGGPSSGPVTDESESAAEASEE